MKCKGNTIVAFCVSGLVLLFLVKALKGKIPHLRFIMTPVVLFPLR